MSKIGEKIINVMKAITKVGKDKTNAFHKYDYVSDEAIVSAIREEIIKNKLVIYPDQEYCEINGEMTTLRVKYTILDTESGETIQAKVYGQGQDKGDKGVYKAATGAEKYFLLKTFLIPTGDDPESESRRATPRRESTVTMPNEPKKSNPKYSYLSLDERKEIFASLEKYNISKETFKTFIQTNYGTQKTEEIPAANYNSIIEWTIKNGQPKTSDPYEPT